ncbi:hypothetical protein ES703_115618 [subsurface metagenome]
MRTRGEVLGEFYKEALRLADDGALWRKSAQLNLEVLIDIRDELINLRRLKEDENKG